MRRIYESDALARDDDDPFAPDEQESTRPRAARSLPVERLVRTLTTAGLRQRALRVRIDAPDTVSVGDRVPFVIELHNPLPVPVSVETVSPLRWWWAVDGHREAAHEPAEPPRESRRLVFDRAERKRFSREWDGQFRVSETAWEPARRGEHTLSATINVADPAASGLTAETTVRLE